MYLLAFVQLTWIIDFITFHQFLTIISWDISINNGPVYIRGWVAMGSSWGSVGIGKGSSKEA